MLLRGWGAVAGLVHIVVRESRAIAPACLIHRLLILPTANRRASRHRRRGAAEARGRAVGPGRQGSAHATRLAGVVADFRQRGLRLRVLEELAVRAAAADEEHQRRRHGDEGDGPHDDSGDGAAREAAAVVAARAGR